MRVDSFALLPVLGGKHQSFSSWTSSLGVDSIFQAEVIPHYFELAERFCYEFTKINMFFFIKFLLLQADLLYLHF